MKGDKSFNYRTPPKIIDLAATILGGIDLDPCAAPNVEHHFAAVNYSLDNGRDGLSEPWNGKVFINPPAGGMTDLFIRKGLSERDRISQLWLLPAWTSFNWWDDLIDIAREFAISTERIRFENARHYSMFPSALALATRNDNLKERFITETYNANFNAYQMIHPLTTLFR